MWEFWNNRGGECNLISLITLILVLVPECSFCKKMVFFHLRGGTWSKKKHYSQGTGHRWSWGRGTLWVRGGHVGCWGVKVCHMVRFFRILGDVDQFLLGHWDMPLLQWVQKKFCGPRSQIRKTCQNFEGVRTSYSYSINATQDNIHYTRLSKDSINRFTMPSAFCCLLSDF